MYRNNNSNDENPYHWRPRHVVGENPDPEEETARLMEEYYACDSDDSSTKDMIKLRMMRVQEGEEPNYELGFDYYDDYEEFDAGFGADEAYDDEFSFYFDDDSYACDENNFAPVTFLRPDGDTEGKDVQWCLDNDFFEVREGYWSGNWYYKFHPEKVVHKEEHLRRTKAICARNDKRRARIRAKREAERPYEEMQSAMLMEVLFADMMRTQYGVHLDAPSPPGSYTSSRGDPGVSLHRSRTSPPPPPYFFQPQSQAQVYGHQQNCHQHHATQNVHDSSQAPPTVKIGSSYFHAISPPQRRYQQQDTLHSKYFQHPDQYMQEYDCKPYSYYEPIQQPNRNGRRKLRQKKANSVEIKNANLMDKMIQWSNGNQGIVDRAREALGNPRLYECLVPGCRSQFSSAEVRDLHSRYETGKAHDAFRRANGMPLAKEALAQLRNGRESLELSKCPICDSKFETKSLVDFHLKNSLHADHRLYRQNHGFEQEWD